MLLTIRDIIDHQKTSIQEMEVYNILSFKKLGKIATYLITIKKNIENLKSEFSRTKLIIIKI